MQQGLVDDLGIENIAMIIVHDIVHNIIDLLEE